MQALQVELHAFKRRHKIQRHNKNETPTQAFRRAATQNNWSADKERLLHAAYTNLLERIEQEQARVASAFEAGILNLTQLNTWLQGLGRQPTTSITKARKTLKETYINIYDLIDGHYDAEKPTRKKLQDYTAAKKLYYPLDAAKIAPVKLFLQRLLSR